MQLAFPYGSQSSVAVGLLGRALHFQKWDIHRVPCTAMNNMKFVALVYQISTYRKEPYFIQFSSQPQLPALSQQPAYSRCSQSNSEMTIAGNHSLLCHLLISSYSFNPNCVTCLLWFGSHEERYNGRILEVKKSHCF